MFLKIVYPSGGMLEMSNGYPSSPLGPSPSPSPGGRHDIFHLIAPKKKIYS
jgi:hypothetical protein